MTEKLKTLMDRAAEVDFDVVDLAAIVESGDRTVRRRRIGVLGGAVALVLVVGTVAFAVGRGDRADDRTPVVGSPAPEVSWVVGDTLHTPTASYDLGHEVRAYVRTSVGFAFLTDGGEVYSFVEGRVRRIGTGATGQPVLLSDTEDSWVGWVDRSAAHPAFVARDLESGKVVRGDVQAEAPGEDGLDLTWYTGIDDDTAYWIDRRGMVALDLGTGESAVVSGATAPWVGNVEDGRQVRLVETASGGDVGSEVVDRDGSVLVPVVRGRYLGAISPDGDWVTSGDGPSIVEIATGKSYPLATQASDAAAYEWLDADTVAVLRDLPGHDDETTQVDLFACEVPSGECAEVVTGLPGLDGGLVLPVSTGLLG